MDLAVAGPADADPAATIRRAARCLPPSVTGPVPADPAFNDLVVADQAIAGLAEVDSAAAVCRAACRCARRRLPVSER